MFTSNFQKQAWISRNIWDEFLQFQIQLYVFSSVFTALNKIQSCQISFCQYEKNHTENVKLFRHNWHKSRALQWLPRLPFLHVNNYSGYLGNLLRRAAATFIHDKVIHLWLTVWWIWRHREMNNWAVIQVLRWIWKRCEKWFFFTKFRINLANFTEYTMLNDSIRVRKHI